jgi:hypothetical protein
VSELPVSTRNKLANLVCLLGSSEEGEVIAAARAIIRILRGAGSDIHTLAAQVEQAEVKLSETEMRKLYDAGYEAGHAADVRVVEAKIQHDEDGFPSVGSPAWPEVVRFCLDRSARLRGNEYGFVADMAGWTQWREPTVKQARWLRSIYSRLGGRP